ncbi:MAG: hypothetical protein LBE62_13115 [Azonexus sp.]|jgi:hypothetical protein|nr:hypothetical protein [Azonexus sp.]
MRLTPHTAHDYAAALAALLPPGKAWEWPEGGLGDAMLFGTAEELARLDADGQAVLDRAIDTHRPKAASWHIDAYRRIAFEAVSIAPEILPRKPFTVGSKAGQRLWSHAAPGLDFPVPLVRVDHLVGPFRAGSKAGERLWGRESRAILYVRYYKTVVDPAKLAAALSEFQQSHVFLWFEDITGQGGFYHAQN